MTVDARALVIRTLFKLFIVPHTSPQKMKRKIDFRRLNWETFFSARTRLLFILVLFLAKSVRHQHLPYIGWLSQMAASAFWGLHNFEKKSCLNNSWKFCQKKNRDLDRLTNDSAQRWHNFLFRAESVLIFSRETSVLWADDMKIN